MAWWFFRPMGDVDAGLRVIMSAHRHCVAGKNVLAFTVAFRYHPSVGSLW
jgi:hypothetical protein